MREQRPIDLVRKEVRHRWLTENEAAIAEYNERIERDGAFSDGWRRF